ncbi:sigma-54 dependent transcriptional regulator, partial [bacterium]|nr:sigma-54 dependent transcriptional regulator [bacterium]
EILRKENTLLKSNFKDRYKFGAIIGKSQPMQEVYELILKAASINANVIIYGESGTGKELVAKAIHDTSDRKNGKFIPVNCGAIPENLLESEFFGYKKGAFTGANTDKEGYLDLADQGTLFLDELGEIDLSLQVKLLRALEGGGYTPVGGQILKRPDVRVVAATNRDLQQLVREGKMREDFFYRVHIIPIHLPALRERKEDIPLLIEHFMRQYSNDQKISPISGQMLEGILNHNWPGNVRELQNVIHRFVSLNIVDFVQLSTPRTQPLVDVPMDMEIHADVSYQEVMDKFEKKLLEESLKRNKWQRESTASYLGIPARTFYRKLKKHGLVRQ